MMHQFREIGILQVFVEFALAQLRFAPRFGDKRQMRVLRQRPAEPFDHENLTRRIRKMLLGANDVRNFQRVIVHNVRQMIDERTVGPLNHMILLVRPVKFDIAANEVVNH